MKTLILTYHRIVETARDFHDVSTPDFLAQLTRLARHRGAPEVVLTFDDGTADHLEAAQLLSAVGLTGIFFPIIDRLDRPGHLTRAHVKQLAEMGHILGSHTLSHRRLPALSDADMNDEMVRSRQCLEDLTGKPVTWFCPPGGFIDGRVFAAARSAGYSHVRGMAWGYAPSLTAPDAVLPTVPVHKDMRLSRFEDIVAGRAHFGAFRLKQVLKALLPEGGYVWLRNQLQRGMP